MSPESTYTHGAPPRVGVLLVNLGTPRSPTPRDVRRYLREFLWDPRVVELPRPLWWLILNGVILNLRPHKSAAAYAKIWTQQGSPLMAISSRLSARVGAALDQRFGDYVTTTCAMRYGEPSVGTELRALRSQHAQHVLVLPLYPQYSATTTAAVFDAVSSELRTWRWVPELQFISSYHDFGPYIEALVAQVRNHWLGHGRGQRLVFSFHGIPKRYANRGDPYHCHCQKTARLVAEQLQLRDDDWMVSFQSRFGREEWLTPYTDVTLAELPGRDIRRVDVVCPGFAADCLETLEEIDMQNRDLFLRAGGESFHYIPSLNDGELHVSALELLISGHIGVWLEKINGASGEGPQQRTRALAMGAPS